MSVIEKLSVISNTITNLMNFVLNDEMIKPDFDEYLRTVVMQNEKVSLQSKLIPYIFERRLTPERKSILKLYEEKVSQISEEEKEVLSGLSASFSSVFEIKRVISSGFELYNLIDEKIYKVVALVKMNNFRGITPAQYAFCRIFQKGDEYYLLEIQNVLSSTKRDEVYKYAIAKIIEKPEEAYIRNPQKEQQICEIVKNFGEKFRECFKTNEIITTNVYADNLINMFNDYCDSGEKPDENEINNNIKIVENNRYFTVQDFNNSYNNFMEKSMEGFSSHTSIYDIGIIYDKELGLFVLPFWQTFCKIYEVEDYKTIQGYKDCIKSFLENDRIPANIIRFAMSKYPDFMKRTNEIMGTNYNSDELLKYYKTESMEKKIYSSASVLYDSKIFEQMMKVISNREEGYINKENIDYSKVGRNDKCPCGSGKKYKHCCMKNN